MDVKLVPMDEEAVKAFESSVLYSEGTGEFQWFGYIDFRSIRKRYIEDGFIGKSDGMLSILVDGTHVGRVEWFESSWGRPQTSACWTIAIGILESFRGRGIGSIAQKALSQYLFSHTRANRIQAYTDVENIAERRALEKSGFQLEGTIRKAQWRDGSWHDVALYAILRENLIA